MNSERGYDAELITIINRSSHIPMRTAHDAITVPIMVRVRLNERMQRGITKQQVIIVQNGVENAPDSLDVKTATSSGSFPYQTVICSANVKYSQRHAIVNMSRPRLLK